MLATAPNKGVHIVATDATVIVGMYDESQQRLSANAKKVVIAFAEYLLDQGF